MSKVMGCFSGASRNFKGGGGGQKILMLQISLKVCSFILKDIDEGYALTYLVKPASDLDPLPEHASGFIV